MSITKAEIVTAIANQVGISRKDATEALEAALGTITSHVAKGEKVTLHGFGTFEARERAARTARNPRTGEAIDVPATRAPAFKPFAAFKDLVA